MLDTPRRYFARQASRDGCELDDEILTVFERFDVVWPLNVRTPNAAAVKVDAWYPPSEPRNLDSAGIGAR